MKESVYNLITELCSSLGKDLVDKTSDNSKSIKRLRSYAFEILLTQRNLLTNDVTEEDPAMFLVDIFGHIYERAKSKGQWNEEMNETVKEQWNKMETLVQVNSSVLSVLKLFLCLADSSPSSEYFEEPSYGLDMRTLITDHSLKHRSLMKSTHTFNYDMFEFPCIQPEPVDFTSAQTFGGIPGTGLRHHMFFTVPNSGGFFSSIGIKNIDDYDLSNANWNFPKLGNVSSELSTTSNVSRTGINQDEGYVTPDQDLKMGREGCSYIPWEQLYEEDFKRFYSWESFGSPVTQKERPYISQNRDAMEHVWKIVHKFNFMSSPIKESSTYRAISLQELERAFSYLLIGVESNIFSYSHDKKSFVLLEGLHLKNQAAKTLEAYCEDFIQCANSFRYLSFVMQKANDSTSSKHGLIYQVLCSNIQRYLQCYRGVVLRMPPLKGLMQTHSWLHKLQTHLQFLVGLCRSENLPRGGALLSFLYNQVPVVTQTDLSFILYYILQSCCTVYFEFLKKWIFEGVCDDNHELFIQSCPFDISYNRKFWSQGFVLNRMLVPGFLKELENDIFVCGKTMALLKLCAPDDPVCLGIKQGYPGIGCCLSKTHLQETEEQCRLYKERCNNHCQQKLGESVAEPRRGQEYYEALREKSLNKIKEDRVEEQKLRFENKRKEFDILKKNMEDAKARKIEDKKNQLEEEIRLIEEAKRVDHFNDLRREEERERLIQYYSAISEAADKRKDKAEWKIKRAQLHEKRVEFFKEEGQFEVLENNDWKFSLGDVKEDEKIKQDSLLETAENIEQLSSVVQGGGDCVVLQTENEKILPSTDSDTGGQLLEINFSMVQDKASQISTDVSKPESEDQTDKLGELDDEKRDWLIALDVADQARQSAVRFKERNMFNDYNILTGETTTYESRFGGKHISNYIEGTPWENIAVFSDTGDDLGKSSVLDPTISNLLENYNIQKTVSDATKSSDIGSCEDVLSEVPIDSSPMMSLHAEGEHPPLKSGLTLKNTKYMLGMFKFNTPKTDLNIDEIDMTTVNQSLRMSVMIPLLTQLELANGAVLRLFLAKHNLLKHLECIRKYFFLLDGEFGRNLTRNLFSEVQTVEHPTQILNVTRLNSLLRMAVGTAIDEEYTERLSFCVKEFPPVFRLIDPKTLDCLSMAYRTHWPLNVIITDEAVMKCDRVFTFLMQLQRTSWALEQDIHLLKDKRLVDSLQFRQVQLYRHIMTHFVTTLKNYVTATVLEESWYKFQEEFKKIKTLDQIYAAHVKYIKMLLFRCLLNKRSRTVNSYLLELFGIILTFHEVLRSGEWIRDSSTSAYQHSGFPRLTHQFDSFLQLSQFLYKYLERLVTHGYQPHLVQLLTLLSANDFYNKQ